MKAIVSLEREDGTFADVGMNTRTIIGPYRLESSVVRKAREYAKGKRARVELFVTRLEGHPYRVIYV